jgi:flagellar motor switch protein FliG
MDIFSTLNKILPVVSKKVGRELKKESAVAIYIKLVVDENAGLKIVAMQKEFEDGSFNNLDVTRANDELL